MVNVRHVLLAAGLVAILGASLIAPADARHRKPIRHSAVQATEIDYDGTPIIMKGYRPKRVRVLPSTGFLIAYDDPVGLARELLAFCG